MKNDGYLEKYISLLEQDLVRAQKDVDRERKQNDFLAGKIERLELAVMSAKSETGREYVSRTEASTPGPRKPPITEARTDTKLKFQDVRDKWDRLTLEQQEKAIADADLVVEPKGRPA